MSKVFFVEWSALQTRGAVDPGPAEAIKSLLVGTESVLSWEDNLSLYGWDSCELFPAWHKGERAWLRRDVWCASEGYSASGTQEYVLSFEEGVKLLIEHGKFAFPRSNE